MTLWWGVITEKVNVTGRCPAESDYSTHVSCRELKASKVRVYAALRSRVVSTRWTVDTVNDIDDQQDSPQSRKVRQNSMPMQGGD